MRSGSGGGRALLGPSSGRHSLPVYPAAITLLPFHSVVQGLSDITYIRLLLPQCPSLFGTPHLPRRPGAVFVLCILEEVAAVLVLLDSWRTELAVPFRSTLVLEGVFLFALLCAFAIETNSLEEAFTAVLVVAALRLGASALRTRGLAHE